MVLKKVRPDLQALSSPVWRGKSGELGALLHLYTLSPRPRQERRGPWLSEEDSLPAVHRVSAGLQWTLALRKEPRCSH